MDKHKPGKISPKFQEKILGSKTGVSGSMRRLMPTHRHSVHTAAVQTKARVVLDIIQAAFAHPGLRKGNIEYNI